MASTHNDDARAYVLRTARENDVKFIRLWFTDVLGLLKSVAITVEELEHALDDGISFDGSSIAGFARSAETDTVLAPAPTPSRVGRAACRASV